MKYYCGLDISLNNTSACIVNQDGEIIREGEVPTEPVAIDLWLKAAGLPMERVGLEAGALTSWLCQELLAADWPAICIEARHAAAAMKAQQVKTDRNDARGIAHIMRTGWFREVHIKSAQSQKLRVLLGNRRCLLDKRIDIDSQIRGTLKIFGHKVGKVSPGKYEKRIRELIQDDAELQAYIFPMLEVRRHLFQQCYVLEKMVLNCVKKDEICKLFMTIPGVGPLTALVFKTFVDRPERFRHSKAVGAAVGLTPRKYASGEVDYDGHVTKCGDAFVRTHLYEAAKVMLSRVGKPNDLKTWGLRLAKRSSKKKACVAVARRLAVTMHAMWRDGTVFELSEEAAAAAA
ncbi:MAG: IS110 family transposase [Pseudomonadota bacterium]